MKENILNYIKHNKLLPMGTQAEDGEDRVVFFLDSRDVPVELSSKVELKCGSFKNNKDVYAFFVEFKFDNYHSYNYWFNLSNDFDYNLLLDMEIQGNIYLNVLDDKGASIKKIAMKNVLGSKIRKFINTVGYNEWSPEEFKKFILTLNTNSQKNAI